jgi:hypothetical protein
VTGERRRGEDEKDDDHVAFKGTEFEEMFDVDEDE